jgi:hypothetical protein
MTHIIWQVLITNGDDGCAVVGVVKAAIAGVDGKQRPPLREEARLGTANYHHIKQPQPLVVLLPANFFTASSRAGSSSNIPKAS